MIGTPLEKICKSKSSSENPPMAFMRLILLLLASIASVLSAPISLELSGGSVIKGDLISWNGQQAVVKAEFGSMTFRRDQLSQATIQTLELLSGDPQKLLVRISELEATVESLRKDNAALRQHLQAATAAQSPQPGAGIGRVAMPPLMRKQPFSL